MLETERFLAFSYSNGVNDDLQTDLSLFYFSKSYSNFSSDSSIVYL